MLYSYGVDYPAFQEAVLDLAEAGTRITKARVAEKLSLPSSQAGELLDRMARDGLLELDIDERSGEIFYERSSRARSAAAKGDALAALGNLAAAATRTGVAAKVGTAVALGEAGSALAPEQRRKLALGVILGGLLPGVGLAYSAPWPIVVASSAVVIVGVKVLSLIPLLSSFLVVPFLVVCAIASAVLGGAYTWRYNQAGKRAALGDEPVSPRQMLARLRKKKA